MFEVNFDGLVGPTHNYAGLSAGNRASQRHSGHVSHPKQAALQSIAKMRFVQSLGLHQAVLPPHDRPAVGVLQQLGFDPSTKAGANEVPAWLWAVVSSASAMWTANAATVSASSSTRDGRVHFTPANLSANVHRGLEAAHTTRVLRAIFSDDNHFCVHDALPSDPLWSDEGAANHTRFVLGGNDVELFVVGRNGPEPVQTPGGYPRRQSLLASQAVARLHGVATPVFVAQSPQAIDAGAFHNDVVAVGNQNLLFAHSEAFAADPRTAIAAAGGAADDLIIVSVSDLSLDDAITTYLFNSQLLSLPDGSMTLVAPTDVEHHEPTASVVADVVADSGNPLNAVHYVDVRESMSNGGGPACLRLRVTMDDAALASIGCGVVDPDFDELEQWVHRHYRDELHPRDLSDPGLVNEVHVALDELTGLLGLGALYDFQR